MAHQNQLLFNLNVPYNAMNMVTQFHNPGPVVIERLGGNVKAGHQGAASETSPPQEPVHFSVVSKEKLAFAMQLARRDMKNKIREQQQLHSKQQEETKEGSPKLKKGIKKKNMPKKTGRYRQQLIASPAGRNVNMNVDKKSVRTQTPSPSRSHRYSRKRSPVLIMQAQPHPHYDLDKQDVKTHPLLKQNNLKPASSTSKATKKQEVEIERLNKELNTCMERISVLSKQVADTAAVSSPDRTATLRAGMEALVRAGRTPTLYSRPKEAELPLPPSIRRQTKPAVARRPRGVSSSGVILPQQLRSKQNRHSNTALQKESLHFAEPTESFKTKARAAQEVKDRVAAATSPRGPPKPAWTPSGSQLSFHRGAGLVRAGKESPRRSQEGGYDSSEDGRGHLSPRRHDSEASDRRGDLIRSDHHMEKHMGHPIAGARQGANPSKISSSGNEPLSERLRLQAHTRERSHSQKDMMQRPDDTNAVHRVECKHGGASYEKDLTRVRRIQQSGAKRRVDFDDRYEAVSGRSSVQHKETNASNNFEHDGRRELAWEEESVEGNRDEDERHISRRSLARLDQRKSSRQESTSSVYKHDKWAVGNPTSKPAIKNMKEQLTDILVDEILEDAVSELERLDGDAMATRHAQIMEDAPTFENILKELEYMEVEEERIRRRWKEVNYEEPQSATLATGQRSEIEGRSPWMSGTPLDAQQMDRLNEIPAQHTAMLFTKPVRQSNQNKDSIIIHQASGDTATTLPDGREEGRPLQPIIVASSKDQGSFTAIGHTPQGPVLRQPGRSEQRDDQISVFVPSEMMHRVQENRDAFQAHLRKTSHLPYGTFDPWKLVERISDDLVNEVLRDVTQEVGEVVGNYVETLYASEFDVKEEGSIEKTKAQKSLFS